MDLRVEMCKIAVARTSDFIMVDPWESLHKEYTPTAKVLDHVDYEINQVLGGVSLPDGTKKPVRVALLAGADLIHTMSTPGVWSDEDLEHILGRYGSFIVERTGTDINKALAQLQKWRENIWVISQLIQNDVSSTKIRQFLSQEMSIQYLVPAPVVQYIRQNDLYHGNHGSPAGQQLNPQQEKLTAEVNG
jgi:nicotinamide mononucleotide adenylyltransferase